MWPAKVIKIFPIKDKDKVPGYSIRISEQESRVLFCNGIENSYYDIFYSIETPTDKKYRFGKELKKMELDTGKSALCDISLFELENKQLVRKVNIELKAHNVQLAHVAKDILKLFAEKQSALFFHTLKSINSGTLNNNGKTGVLDKYQKSIDWYKDKWKPSIDGKDKYIVFFICIIDKKISLMRIFRKNDLQKQVSVIKLDSQIENFLYYL